MVSYICKIFMEKITLDFSISLGCAFCLDQSTSSWRWDLRTRYMAVNQNEPVLRCVLFPLLEHLCNSEGPPTKASSLWFDPQDTVPKCLWKFHLCLLQTGISLSLYFTCINRDRFQMIPMHPCINVTLSNKNG